MTGRSNSATTSRMMWMLSASSARRWSMWGVIARFGVSVSAIVVCIVGIKKARGVGPGLVDLPRGSLLADVRQLNGKTDGRRDLDGPSTGATTGAGQTVSRHQNPQYGTSCPAEVKFGRICGALSLSVC